ncbi:LysR family transcriptional regulator [Celeribacter ethanolicus]|uniref:LysR family transcriptional regulator n=1 Tax=Celeribacter ethanolicus TaxID=1758178 RepID=UPI0008331F61|nr:LysR family transcriptional regulator [Celeribacter ethanolicus]
MSYSTTITIRQLEVLHGITCAGSIRKAAQVMGVTQPTISAQLAKMESTLGAELINRDRKRHTLLTGAGELWAETARRVLSELEVGQQIHAEHFGKNAYKMTFVTIPSHSGVVLGLAADAAEIDPNIADFSVHFSASSKTMLDFMAVRKASVGLMRMTGSLRETQSLKREFLYDDRILWAVPKSVNQALVKRIIESEALPEVLPKPLRKRVLVEAQHEWRETSDDWYHAMLPSARPYFSCDLHVSAIEIVVAQLATCHISMTHHSNLPQRIHDAVNFYDIGRKMQEMVLVMPRHLMAVPTFVSYFNRLTTAVREHYERCQSSSPAIIQF